MDAPTRFEQGFVFRITRALPLTLAGIATLLLIGAANLEQVS
jgi:hypothetical protein